MDHIERDNKLLNERLTDMQYKSSDDNKKLEELNLLYNRL